MSDKREYLLQKGRQLQALQEQVETKSPPTSATTGKQAREVAKYRDLCPPGTEDSQIVHLLAQTKGDAQKIELAISELWEDYRGSGQDEWATVEKKGKKKLEAPSSFRRDGSRSGPRPSHKAAAQPTDEETPEGGDRSENRGGRGSTRGRGAPASRGGRGGGRGRGRGAAPPRSSTRGDAEQDEAEAEETEYSAPKKPEPKAAPAAVAPAPDIPNLEGAWKQKPTFLSKPKPAEPAPKPIQKQPAAPSSPVRKAAPAAPTASASPAPAPAATPVPAAPATTPATSVTSPKATSPKKTAPVTSPKKVASPVQETKKVEKVASPKAEKKLESPSISAWGSLDVSTSSIGDWSAAPTEKKTAQTPNAWARGSPLISTTEKPSAPTPIMTPTSPKEIPVARSEPVSASSATSPKYLNLGKWDTGAATNLSLQFGSFSLNGVEHVESTSPRGWGAAPASSLAKASKPEPTNAWGTQSSSPKKAVLSPKGESHVKSATGASAPPGLSVESGRVTPKSAQSPRSFAPSAPSPASLPKPDDVKRSTPTRGQVPFQNQAAPQTQTSSKIGSGSSYASDFNAKSANLYQPSYGQYSMGIGGAPSQAQMAGASNTPKGAATRGAPAQASAQSPSHGAQQSQASQFHQQQTQSQQQKPAQQQSQQAQGQQQVHAHGQHNVPHHHQAGPPGYHPHYAPPPPPGMAMPYNPYNYASYYQGYGYYQNPQYAQYSPRAQYPPRGSVPYGVEGPVPGFANPGSVPGGYQDQHLLHQHEYAGAIPQGFGEISGAGYLQPGHHHHHQQSGPQSHGKGSSQISSSQAPRSGSSMQGYQGASSSSSRDHNTNGPQGQNPSANASAGSYSQQQHYGWASYGGQPVGGWGHMMPQGYQQQNPSHQHPGSHQSYRQYGGNNSQGANSGSEGASGSSGNHGHAWSS